MRVFEPYQVTILTTSKCTASCRHCCMNSSPDRDDTLTYAQMEKILLQLFEEVKLKVVVFAGGEPTLLGDDLYRAFRLCKDHGVPVTRMVTNAYWAHSPEAARAKLLELRQAGLDELNISTDDYHLPYIELDKVRIAYEEALKIDFTAVVVTNAYGPNSTVTPELLRSEFRADELKLRKVDDGVSQQFRAVRGRQLVVLSNAHVQRLGRGVCGVKQSEMMSPHMTLEELSEKVGGCPWAVRSAAISSRGHFVSCCGFETENNPVLDYGDLDEQPLKDLMDKADNDLLTNMIAIFGPVQVMQLLKETCPDEVEFPRHYTSYCEACEDLVSIKKNREALYRHMDQFAEPVLQARAALTRQFEKNGRIVIPPSQQIVTHLSRRAGTVQDISEMTMQLTEGPNEEVAL